MPHLSQGSSLLWLAWSLLLTIWVAWPVAGTLWAPFPYLQKDGGGSGTSSAPGK